MLFLDRGQAPITSTSRIARGASSYSSLAWQGFWTPILFAFHPIGICRIGFVMQTCDLLVSSPSVVVIYKAIHRENHLIIKNDGLDITTMSGEFRLCDLPYIILWQFIRSHVDTSSPFTDKQTIFCHLHHILVMCLQPQSSCSGQHNHKKDCSYQILNKAQQKAFKKDGYDSASTWQWVTELFSECFDGATPWLWQLDVTEAILLGVDSLVIAGTGTMPFMMPLMFSAWKSSYRTAKRL